MMCPSAIGPIQSQAYIVAHSTVPIPSPGNVLPSDDPCTGKMIIGHLNLIRLAQLALLLSITVGRILPGEGIRSGQRRPPPASTGLHRPSTGPPHDSTRIHWNLQERCLSSTNPISGHVLGTVRRSAWWSPKRYTKEKEWGKTGLGPSLRSFHFSICPGPADPLFIIRRPSSVNCHQAPPTLPRGENRPWHGMFPTQVSLLFQSSLTRSCYPCVRLFGLFGVCVFACSRVSVFARESNPLQLNELTTWGVDTPQSSPINLLSFTIRISYSISSSYPLYFAVT